MSDSNKTAFFQLTTPADLLRKARHDLNRIKDDRHDAYAAFDFLVTILHFPEWLNRSGQKWEKPGAGEAAALLTLVDKLANGAKHFVMDKKLVEGGTSVHQGAFGPGFSPGFNVDALLVKLDSSEAAVLG